MTSFEEKATNEWTDDDWRAYRADRLGRIPAETQTQIIAMFREELAEIIPELRERIAENPLHWIGGRENGACGACGGKGEFNMFDASRPCSACKGTKIGREMPLHHGWGTSIRNLMRQNGFTDEALGMNLDEVYVPLLELAATT